MIFTSLEYILFLPIIVLLIELIRKREYQCTVLLVGSYFFYYYTSSEFVFIMVILTVVSYYMGKKISVEKNEKTKKIFLGISIGFSLLLLGYFKYYNFLISNLNSLSLLSFPELEVILPIGISFYTFETISYVTDIYRGSSPPALSFKKYALYIAFFPHLVAGPIVRGYELLPQFENTLRILPENLSYGIIRISWGLFKKIVIADNIAPYVSMTLDHPIGHTSMDIIVATFLFGIQIYCDFSGYCDIALGSARIFGIHLPENFLSPYLSKRPTEFWSRWHITLGRFIRDYIYIPLGGNRRGSLRTYLNLFIAMILCGLWHGASWNFILWGAYHGLCLTIDKFFSNIFVGFDESSKTKWFLSLIITQYFMFLGWVFFRVSGIQELIYCLSKFIVPDFIFNSPVNILLTFLGMIITFFLIINLNIMRIIHKYQERSPFDILNSLKVYHRLIFLICISFLIFLLSPSNSPTFIYFQF